MQDDFRYEIKYEINPEDAHSIFHILQQHPLGFYKAFPDRWVNNIYFDTPGFTTCEENLIGISNRKKFRLRWYGAQDEIVSPVLEIKIKSNMVGRKASHRLPADVPLPDFIDELKQSNIMPSALHPVIFNRYLRSYFINMEGNFRITVDRAIQHRACMQLKPDTKSASVDYPLIILELKFAKSDYPQQKSVSRFIPYRQTKHSKYVSAVLDCLAYP